MTTRFTLTVLFCLVGPSSRAYELNPDNGHIYELRLQNVTWEQARTQAIQSTYAGITGDLATITSAAEQAFLQSKYQFTFQKLWLGGYQPAGSTEPGGNWQWVTGEPFVYTNWLPVEPNNVDGAENLLEMFPGGGWNDVGPLEFIRQPNRRAYIVEFSVPEPSTLAIAASTCCMGVLPIRGRLKVGRG